MSAAAACGTSCNVRTSCPTWRPAPPTEMGQRTETPCHPEEEEEEEEEEERAQQRREQEDESDRQE
eukprot:3763110-Pyramimonas_sp.AAC.1